VKDTQDDLKYDDADNNRENKEYTAEWDQMGCSETDVKKGASGKNDKKQMDDPMG
jgi:hypothetical protein